MSYILDALRKADADRERDPARGIHAHPVPVREVNASSSRWHLVAGAAGGIAVAAVAVMLWPSERETVVVAAPQVTRPAASVLPAPAVLPPAPSPEPQVVRTVAARPAPMAVPVTAAPAASSAASAAAPAGPADRIFNVAELPADIQRDLPKLPISGGVFSENAAQRMLIVNGQVANEGAQLAPGLVLEQIRAKSAVLKFRGWKYSVAY